MTQEASQSTLLELLHGAGAHADPVACVDDIPAELAGRQLEGYPHSIWQIVFHMNYWMDYELRRIQEQEPPYPKHAAESWPPISDPPAELEWKREVRRFADLIEDLALLAESGPELLRREVSAIHPANAERSSSVLAVLWQTVVHNSYHVGQVALLRRALGVWPPQAGGDTW